MSKKIPPATLIDHIGWDLWLATQGWKTTFTQKMVSHGFVWFGEARGSLIQHIGPDSTPQITLAKKAGISKQAIQQQLDELVTDGIVKRVPDPKDARKKCIVLTSQGINAQSIANKIKLEIENDYTKLIGEPQMIVLKVLLKKLNDPSLIRV